MSRVVRILLHGQHVATLFEEVGPDLPRYVLSFEATWATDSARDTLTLAARDWRLDRQRVFEGQLPPFLCHLVPEPNSPLRRRIQRAVGLDEEDELGLLLHVGEGLGGAISALAGEGPAPLRHRAAGLGPAEIDPSRLRWSHGGMQLKFSVERSDRLRLPLGGRHGHWILKVPDLGHPLLPSWELAALRWAGACGFPVAGAERVRLAEVEGLPESVTRGLDEGLLVRRFDRGPEGQRLHMEELGAAVGVQPWEKYQENGGWHQVAICRLVGRLCGPEAREQLILRLVFDVLVGNGDAHLRNHALLFPNRRHPVLAPCYDIVPTAVLIRDRRSALRMGPEWRSFDQIEMIDVQELARSAGADPARLEAQVLHLLERARACLGEALEGTGLEPVHGELWLRYMERCPIWQGRPPRLRSLRP